MAHVLKKQLKTLKGKEFVEDITKYIKSPHEFYGSKVPELRTMAKHLHEENSLTEFYKIFDNLWKSGYNDKISLAINTLKLYEDEFDLRTWKFIKIKLKDIKSWDQIDAIAKGIVGVILVKDPRLEKEIVSMAKGSDLWMKRMAIVSTIPLIEKKNYSLAMKFTDLYLNYKDENIQKAVGIILRELGKQKPEQTKRFILKNRDMPKPAFYIATENMLELRKLQGLEGLGGNNKGFFGRLLG
tara:strand:- start:81 stop:803 length:723 start_codon:yes stop_codon:yes gene_type:complete